MRINISRKAWISLGTTTGLIFLIWAASTALAQGPDDPETPPFLPPNMPPESAAASAEPEGGPNETMAFTYQGLLEIDGQPVTGNYTFSVELWDDESGGAYHGNCDAGGTGGFVDTFVEDGIFTLYLICADWNSDVFNGGGRWLNIWVTPTGIADWVLLTDPRQPISPTPYAFSLFPGAHIEGGVSSPSAVINAVGTLGTIWDAPFAIYGEAPDIAIYGDGGRYGVRGFGNSAGVQGQGGLIGVSGSGNQYGVSGYANWPEAVDVPTYGLYGYSGSGSNDSYGVYGYGYYGGGARFVTYDGNLIEGWEDVTGNGFDPAYDTRRFRVTWNGHVYAASYNVSSPADFAEVLPAAGDPEPGDVLVVGLDGQLVQSNEPYQPTVVGVFSTQPAYVGGAANLGQEGYVPLAVVGLVPVKVSAENGPIAPGDLLVTSSIPGHAMRGGEDPPTGTVVGKALEGLESGTGVIQMLVLLQ